MDAERGGPGPGHILVWGPPPASSQLPALRLSLPASWAPGPTWVILPRDRELAAALLARLEPWSPRELVVPAPAGPPAPPPVPIASEAADLAGRGGRVLAVVDGIPWQDPLAQALLEARSRRGTFGLTVLEQAWPGQTASLSETPLDRLEAIMGRLLGPGGCPWDREQTHRTLRPYLLEEAAEVLECIERDRADQLAGELGDLLLQIAFHAALGSRVGAFDLAGVAEAIEHKMVFRHPHVFGDRQVAGAAEVVRNWELIKAGEAGASGEPGPDGPWRDLRKAAVRVGLAALEAAFAAAQGDRAGYRLARRELHRGLRLLRIGGPKP